MNEVTELKALKKTVKQLSSRSLHVEAFRWQCLRLNLAFHTSTPVQLCPAGLLTFLRALESLKQFVSFSLKRITARPEERRIEILPFKLQSQGQEVKPAASWNTHTHTQSLLSLQG